MNNLVGQGLSSLISVNLDKKKPQNEVSIDLIDACDYQPRTIFEEESLVELKDSIVENGIIQPLIVTKNGDRYKLIAGERRLRASKMAGLTVVPVVVKEADNKSISLMSLIENVQRKDLSCIEIARAYRRIIDEFAFSHEELAKKIGTNKSNVSNHLRLLNMPEKILGMIESKAISFGHAKVLAAIKDESILTDLVDLIATDNISVKKLTELIDQFSNEKTEPESKIVQSDIIANNDFHSDESSDIMKSDEKDFESHQIVSDKTVINKYLEGYSLPIELKKNKDNSGRISIECSDQSQIDAILKFLKNLI